MHRMLGVLRGDEQVLQVHLDHVVLEVSWVAFVNHVALERMQRLPGEAAEAFEIIKPKVAVPMHYGVLVGTKGDAEEFKRLCRRGVILLEKKN